MNPRMCPTRATTRALAGLFVWALAGICQAEAIASVLRVTVDGEPTEAGRSGSYGVESVLLRHLQERGFENVDLSPLHADFQVLRYTSTCPVVDGGSTQHDCAQFGNYAEAVLHVIESIRYGVDQALLPKLGPDDSILIGEIRLINAPRQVRGEMFYRLYDFADTSQSWADDHFVDRRIQSKATREGVTSEVLDMLIERAVLKISEK